MNIQPQDLLEVGTAVRVQGMNGKVTKAEMTRDQFGGPIAVHTCKFTERFKSRQGDRAIYKPIDPPITRKVNYSFISVIGGAK